VLRHGWSRRAGAFTQYFGSDDLDASSLMMPVVGFLPAADPRVLATIDAIAERLTDECGLVYRYDTRGGADGLEGREGTFVLCTFWLAQALALAGQPERARHVFERAISYVNDVGLLAEEVDPATGELLGNFPPGLQPHRTHQRRLGHLRGRAPAGGRHWQLTGRAQVPPARQSSGHDPAASPAWPADGVRRLRRLAVGDLRARSGPRLLAGVMTMAKGLRCVMPGVAAMSRRRTPGSRAMQTRGPGTV